MWINFRCNFSEVEIEVFFARYDIDGKFVYVPEEEESNEKEKKGKSFNEAIL